MKKMMLVAAACAMVAAPSMILADDPVTSVNVVGYYTVEVPAGGQIMLSAPLIPMDGTTIADILGDQLPNGSRVYIWDRTKTPAGYTIARFESGPFGGDPAWAGDGASLPILGGDGFVVLTPAGEGPHPVTIMGEVPTDGNDSATKVIPNISGVELVAYAFPVDVVFTNTTLAANQDVQQIYTWGESGYTPYSRMSAGFGQPAFSGDWPSNSPVIKSGTAFWVRTAAPLDWTEVAPYADNL